MRIELIYACILGLWAIGVLAICAYVTAEDFRSEDRLFLWQRRNK